MKKQSLHQLNRIIYLNATFEPSTTYEFAPVFVSQGETVFVYFQPLPRVLSNLGFEWFYAYNYARYGIGSTAKYSVYSASVGGLLIDNTEIKFEPTSVENLGPNDPTLPTSFFSSLGITKVEFSNDNGTSWTEEKGKSASMEIRVVSGVQNLAIRFGNGTGMAGVNKIRFTFSNPVNRLYFALYNECKEG